MLHVPSAKMLSDLLLVLYEEARTPAVEVFQEKALDAIGRVVPFDASIWGIGTVSHGKTVVHGAHSRNFSDEAVDIINREDEHNIVGQTIRDRPGIAHTFSSAELFADPATRTLWKKVGGFREVLGLGLIDETSGLLSFFAVARFAGGHAFTPDEARWIEIIAPHLEATLQICRVSELQKLKPDGRTHPARRAVCDARGVLHVAEPGFAALLLEGWPRWKGPLLPRELVEIASASGTRELRHGNLTLSASGVPQQRVIMVTRKLPIDLLTPREQDVAEAFAAGLTYKEVARQLERSPATVRHHLRSVYEKLGVGDKAALARAILDSGGDRKES